MYLNSNFIFFLFIYLQKVSWLKAKHAKFKIKSCLEIKYEINANLPSARARRFKSIEQRLLHWIRFECALSNPGDEDMDCGTLCLRHAIVIFVWFWLGRSVIHFSFYQGFIQSSPNELWFTSVMNSSQELTIMKLIITYRG